MLLVLGHSIAGHTLLSPQAMASVPLNQPQWQEGDRLSNPLALTVRESLNSVTSKPQQYRDVSRFPRSQLCDSTRIIMESLQFEPRQSPSRCTVAPLEMESFAKCEQHS